MHTRIFFSIFSLNLIQNRFCFVLFSFLMLWYWFIFFIDLFYVCLFVFHSAVSSVLVFFAYKLFALKNVVFFFFHGIFVLDCILPSRHKNVMQCIVWMAERAHSSKLINYSFVTDCKTAKDGCAFVRISNKTNIEFVFVVLVLSVLTTFSSYRLSIHTYDFYI